jgi:TolA-binding protein
MIRRLLPLVAALLFTGACAPLVELEDENIALRSKVDSLEIMIAECSGQEVLLKDRLAAIEAQNLELDDRNRELTASLAETQYSAQTTESAQVADATASAAVFPPAESESPAAADAGTPSTEPAYDGTVTPGLQFLRQYQSALSAYNGKKYEDAVGLFEGLLATGQRNDMIDNCHYWLGEAMAQLGDNTNAIAHFGRAVACRGADKVDDALYSRATVQRTEGNTAAARADLERLLSEFPHSELASQARSTLRVLR